MQDFSVFLPDGNILAIACEDIFLGDSYHRFFDKDKNLVAVVPNTYLIVKMDRDELNNVEKIF